MESISTTGTNSSNIPSVKAFANAYNGAFPLKIEKEYVRLVNLIYEYVTACHQIGKIDDVNYYRHLNLNWQYKKLETLRSLDKNELLTRCVESLSDSTTPETYEKISCIAKIASELARDKQNLESIIQTRLDDIFSKEQEAFETRNRLAAVINEISVQLQVIGSMDLTTEKRIDTLEITQRHFSIMDNLDISSKEKEVLKRELVSYFNMRRSAFKLLEEFGYQIIDSYRKRLVLDHNAANVTNYNKVDPNFEIYRIALEILSVYSRNRRLGTIHQSSCEEISNECNILDLLSSAFINREYNKEDFENALNTYRFSEIDTNLVDVLNHLIYSVSDYTESHGRH